MTRKTQNSIKKSSESDSHNVQPQVEYVRKKPTKVAQDTLRYSHHRKIKE